MLHLGWLIFSSQIDRRDVIFPKAQVSFEVQNTSDLIAQGAIFDNQAKPDVATGNIIFDLKSWFYVHLMQMLQPESLKAESNLTILKKRFGSLTSEKIVLFRKSL